MNRPPLYFLALMPPENIRLAIENIKIEIKDKFHISHALKLPAHITLKIPFRIESPLEEVIIESINEYCHKQIPFEVSLDGFDHFGKHVIFINVAGHQKLVKLHKDILSLITEKLVLKSHEISSKIHPHITIATRDLKRSDFLKIWGNFKDRNFSAKFLARDIYLFKHNGNTWDICKRFRFG